MDFYGGRGQCPIFLEHFISNAFLCVFHHNIVNVTVISYISSKNIETTCLY